MKSVLVAWCLSVNVFQSVQSGLIKAYAATTKKRLAVLPDLPTAAESGLPDFEITVWFSRLAGGRLRPFDRAAKPLFGLRV
jgi:tripartite-type tricarboxylate transporter receptor subunit TctC